MNYKVDISIDARLNYGLVKEAQLILEELYCRGNTNTDILKEISKTGSLIYLISELSFDEYIKLRTIEKKETSSSGEEQVIFITNVEITESGKTYLSKNNPELKERKTAHILNGSLEQKLVALVA